MPDPWSPQRPGPGGELRVEPRVTVITPTIPGRFDLLHEAMESVRRQTLPGVEHAVEIDTQEEGPAVLRNRMLHAATTPLVAFLDDDDLLDPTHLEELLAALELEPAGDVAWSFHRGGPRTPRPSSERELWRIMRAGRNCIAVTVLARRDVLLAAGGFDPAARYEDYDLWMRLRGGARFICVARETWTYRIQTDSRTHA